MGVHLTHVLTRKAAYRRVPRSQPGRSAVAVKLISESVGGQSACKWRNRRGASQSPVRGSRSVFTPGTTPLFSCEYHLHNIRFSFCVLSVFFLRVCVVTHGFERRVIKAVRRQNPHVEKKLGKAVRDGKSFTIRWEIFCNFYFVCGVSCPLFRTRARVCVCCAS